MRVDESVPAWVKRQRRQGRSSGYKIVRWIGFGQARNADPDGRSEGGSVRPTSEIYAFPSARSLDAASRPNRAADVA